MKSPTSVCWFSLGHSDLKDVLLYAVGNRKEGEPFEEFNEVIEAVRRRVGEAVTVMYYARAPWKRTHRARSYLARQGIVRGNTFEFYLLQSHERSSKFWQSVSYTRRSIAIA